MFFRFGEFTETHISGSKRKRDLGDRKGLTFRQLGICPTPNMTTFPNFNLSPPYFSSLPLF